MPDPVLPDYRGASTAGIVPALLGKTDRDWLPSPVHDASTVVVLVIDGLGHGAVTDRPEVLVNLAGMEGGATTTVIPATTSAALTSIATGLAPIRHGVTGYRMRVDDAVLNVLRWTREPKGVAPEPESVQRHAPFCGSPVPVVTKSEFERSGFTRAHLRGVPFHGWRTPSMLVEHCRRLALARHPIVYAYYPGVDEVAHEFGLHDGYYEQELRYADELVGRLLAALPEHAALLVTADHGQVHLEPEAWIEITDIAALVATQAGDARFRHLYARPGAARELAAEAERRYGDRAWVMTRRAILDAEWLGAPGAEGSAAGRIGDVVLAPFAAVGFVDPALPRERELRSAHGAPTPDEMLVPLLSARGLA
jgi:Type I phosphodiesterase / nucleotide pyrophosphatase